MKQIFTLFQTVLIIAILFVQLPLNAQQRQSYKLTAEELDLKQSSLDPTSRHNVYGQKRYEASSPESVTDTLNFPLEGEYNLYDYEGGYISGNNDYFDKAKANYFEGPQPYMITGILIDFAWATGSNTDIEVAVWGESKSPGSKIGSQTIGLQTIINDVANEQTTLVNFDNPIIVNGDFYVGVVLPTAPGDTVAVYTNTDGDTDPATAWEQWSDNSWVTFDDPTSWGRKVALAIFPIVQSGELFAADFSAEPTTLTEGGSVQFTDESIGDPETWEWAFEGGFPATSSMQNPMVTYNEPGLYEVSLTITKGTDNSTKTLENFITVNPPQTSMTDTLNFPLPGEFIVYMLNDNGGFVNGNNVYGDLGKANKFILTEEAKITGILYDFAWATGGNPDIEMAVWNHNMSTGKPGMKLGSETIPLNTIKDDIQNFSLTYVPFDPPINVSQAFYAGFLLPQAAGDTLVVWGNTDGDTNPGTAWDLWNDNTWHPFNETGSWELNIALGVHPIVEYTLGFEDKTANLGLTIVPNPANDFIQVSWDPSSITTTAVKLLSMDGVVQKEIIPEAAASKIRVKLDRLPSGIYFVQLITEKGIETRKVIRR
ncbi:MAG: T9SS type A sorting domain-containing protein [Bacteroidetes bacterium]|nr:T9SS type A sorting domain-containing protein [Bacteroidota bacterium]